MKKNIKLSVAVLVTVASLFMSGFSSLAASKSLPIYSIGAAVAHNAGLVKSIYGDVYASSMLYTNGLKTWFSVDYTNKIPSPESMAALVRGQLLSYKIASPSNDWVNAYVSYNSADGDQLFEGGTGFRLEQKANGSWKMPTNAANVSSYLGQYCPIDEEGAIGAYIILRNNEGYVMSYVNVDVNYNADKNVGRIKYPTLYLAQNGQLMVNYAQRDANGSITNSYNVAFDIQNDGVQMTPVSGSFTLQTDFMQWVPLIPPDITLTNLQSYQHHGTSPLVSFTVTNAMWVHFSASTMENENAIVVFLRKLEAGRDTDWVPYDIPTIYPFAYSLFLQPGDYQVDFGWQFFSPWPVNQGEKGGGGVSVPVG